MINNILQNNVVGTYGETGKTWLEKLPDLLRQCEQKLNIKINKPFKDLSFNYVASATLLNGEQAVFKCGVASSELKIEIAALKHFAGNGAVKLIDANVEEGWLILEKLMPGDMLSELSDDDQVTRLAAQIMQKLWRPIDQNKFVFPTIGKWLKRLDEPYTKNKIAASSLHKNLVDRAAKMSKELLKSQGEQVLLHGDLHHYNILSATRAPWLAIDPKGVIGEREFEIGALIKNPIYKLNSINNLKSLFASRFDILVEMTNFDKQKIIAWSFVMAVLSACWASDSCDEHENLLVHIAENLEKLL